MVPFTDRCLDFLNCLFFKKVRKKGSLISGIKHFQRSNDTMRNTESTVFKDSPTHQLSNDENFTSNNLRFLRDRLSELRNKNENLQRKYNQVQNSFEENLRHSLSKDENQADSKHSKESESPRHLGKCI